MAQTTDFTEATTKHFENPFITKRTDFYEAMANQTQFYLNGIIPKHFRNN